MGRGAVVALDPSPDDIVDILANGLPVARGRVGVEGGAIRVEVTEMVRKPTVTRTPGATIGGWLVGADLAAPVEAAPPPGQAEAHL